MIEWLQLSVCTEGLFFVLAAGTEVEQLSIVLPVSAYDNTDHSHTEFVSTAQGGPDENAGVSSADRHFSRNTAGSVQAGQLSPTPQGTAVPGHSLCVYLSPVHADGIPRAVASLLFPVCGNRSFCAVSFWQDLVMSFDYANSHPIVETNLQT